MFRSSTLSGGLFTRHYKAILTVQCTFTFCGQDNSLSEDEVQRILQAKCALAGIKWCKTSACVSSYMIVLTAAHRGGSTVLQLLIETDRHEAEDGERNYE